VSQSAVDQRSVGGMGGASAIPQKGLAHPISGNDSGQWFRRRHCCSAYSHTESVNHMALGRTGNYIVEVASINTQDEVSYLFGRSHCFPTKRFACVLEKSIAECFNAITQTPARR
jgi:hypothetical protein